MDATNHATKNASVMLTDAKFDEDADEAAFMATIRKEQVSRFARSLFVLKILRLTSSAFSTQVPSTVVEEVLLKESNHSEQR